MKKCWFWAHDWSEWERDRIENFEGLYMRRRRFRQWYKRTCNKCGHVQDYYEDDVWWEI